VSSVEDSQIYRNQLQYVIRWTGYDSLTWEHSKFVDGLQAVEEFHQRYPRKPGLLENALGGPRAEGGDTGTVPESTEVLGNNGGRFWQVWKEFCYRKPETLRDAENAAKLVAG
jgi:hypothetical protein